MEDFLSKLNSEQIKPVLATEGSVLVIAGAGSGKTRVLTTRIAYLINEKGVNPQNVLAITFTNKAANEMKERLKIMTENASGIWISTIHSMCVRILREEIYRLGDKYNSNFTIYDEIDQDRILKRITDELGYDEKFLKKAKFHISNAKSKALSPEEYLKENEKEQYIEEYCKVYKRYEETLINAIDFDGILLKTYELFIKCPEVLDYYSNKFLYIHVDEFQDTNPVQFKIIKMLSKVHGNLFVVGDDDQSIYSFRGADIKNILGFERSMKGAKVFKLERNYRSTKKILDFANKVIKNNIGRNDKTLWTEEKEGEAPELYVGEQESDEAAYTALQIKNLMARYPKLSYKDFAVLMRVNALSRAYEQEFMKYGIPYKIYGGQRFYERKEIKDCLAYLKLINNPLDNEAFRRIINVPKRGIGEKSLAAFQCYATEKGFSLFEALMEVGNIDLGKAAAEKFKAFKELIVSLMVVKETESLSEFAKLVTEKTGISTMYLEDTDENFSRRMNIDEFINSVIEFERANENPSLSDYLNSVTLSSEADDVAGDNAVSIATIHAVKGLEFRVVFICGLEEGIFPTKRAMGDKRLVEEERRLMYVAATRARDRLFLTRAKSRYLYQERMKFERSRFLEEVFPEKTKTYQKPERSFREERFIDDDKIESSTPFSGGYGSDYAEQYLKKAEEKKLAENKGYRTGMKVRHAKFGEGIVITVKGEGNNVLVDVAFGGVGIKSLSARFAPMEIIG